MEFSDYMRFVIALAFVLALIGLLSWVVKRYGAGGRAAIRLGKSRRLQIVETVSIDSRHRAVLLRRDDIEHLVLLGPGNDFLIERDIKTDPRGNTQPMPEMTAAADEGATEQT
jgi:flagellar protein FliO/FliZ